VLADEVDLHRFCAGQAHAHGPRVPTGAAEDHSKETDVTAAPGVPEHMRAGKVSLGERRMDRVASRDIS
jgi:hypothetical protein